MRMLHIEPLPSSMVEKCTPYQHASDFEMLSGAMNATSVPQSTIRATIYTPINRIPLAAATSLLCNNVADLMQSLAAPIGEDKTFSRGGSNGAHK